MIEQRAVQQRQCALTLNEIFNKSENNLNVIVWKKIHFPFALPPSSFNYHKCKWTRIQQDVFGCSLCGAIHKCSFETCKPFTVVTEDFEICTISGICLRTTAPEHGQEFHDQILYWPDPSEAHTAKRQNSADFDKITCYVEELLLSAESYSLWEQRMKKLHAALCKSVETEFDASKSFIDQFETLISSTVLRQKVCFSYNRGLREQVAKRCCEQILHTLSLCSRQFKLGTKQNDLRNTVFGLIYLMREGVTFANVFVVPKIDPLQFLLPAESSLFKSFNFKPKFITDIENRCKFGFRTGMIGSTHMQDLTEKK